jgi:hypothetical protein
MRAVVEAEHINQVVTVVPEETAAEEMPVHIVVQQQELRVVPILAVAVEEAATELPRVIYGEGQEVQEL